VRSSWRIDASSVAVSLLLVGFTFVVIVLNWWPAWHVCT
jgi:hypothetical protein